MLDLRLVEPTVCGFVGGEFLQFDGSDAVLLDEWQSFFSLIIANVSSAEYCGTLLQEKVVFFLENVKLLYYAREKMITSDQIWAIFLSDQIKTDLNVSFPGMV